MNEIELERILIPWRHGSNAARFDALRAVRRHYANAGVEPTVIDARAYVGPEPWSPGRARNWGARVFPDMDPLVYVDADSVVDADQLRQAWRMAALEPGLVYAYDLYVRLDRDGREQQAIPYAPSMAAIAIGRETFDEVGGFDEGFIGWGYEDVDFANRCATVAPIRRVSGPVRHLWHGHRNPDDSPADSDPDQVAANLLRLRGKVYA